MKSIDLICIAFIDQYQPIETLEIHTDLYSIEIEPLALRVTQWVFV